MNIKIFLASICCLLSITSLISEIRLPSVFTDGMVLQQSSDVMVWGKATPNNKVQISVSWAKDKYMTFADNDSIWRVKIKTPGASYKTCFLEISCKEKIRINNVLIGEVWFAGGQSNMEMTLNGYPGQPVSGAIKDIADSKNNYIRFYTVSHVSALEKQWDCPGRWETASPSTTGNFSATAYYFARQLQQVLNIPVAILHCSWGGSTIEAWMSPESMSITPELKIPRTVEENNPKHQKPTGLYKGMLSSLVGYGIKGVVWYQGESNRTNYNTYAKQFPAMRESWIKEWGIGVFPFYFAQLAPYAYPDKRYNCAFMREVQGELAREIPNVGMAVLMDIGDSASIHPPYKKEAGERLAYLAMNKTYCFYEFQCQSPEYKSYDIKDGKIYLKFDFAPQWLSSFGKKLSGFEIAGKDKVFYPAQAELTRTSLSVSSDKVSAPVAVRYCFKDYAIGSLFGVNGLPVSSFRTDTWDDVINN